MKVREATVPGYARGEIAERLSRQPAGTFVRILGELKTEQWKAKNGDKHEKLEIEAQKLFVPTLRRQYRVEP